MNSVDELKKRFQEWAPWWVLAFSLLITFVGWQSANEYVLALRKQSFADEVAYARKLITDRMHNYEQVLLGAVGLADASSRMSRESWAAYYLALRLEERFPGIQGLGYVAAFPPAAKEAHEYDIREQGFSQYAVWPEGRRERYSAIVYLEPDFEGNQHALGFDMLVDPIRRIAMDDARDTGQPSLSAITPLIQEPNQQPQTGALLFLPVYRRGNSVDTVEQRRAALQGYVFAPFRMNNLMAGVFDQRSRGELDYALYDGVRVVSDALLYDSTTHLAASPPKEGEELEQRIVIDMPGRSWTGVFRARDSFIHHTTSSLPAIILFGGLVADLMLFALLMLFSRARSMALSQAMVMTQESRESEARFRLAVEASPSGVLMVKSNGCIVLANRVVERMFGYEPGELVGTFVDTLLPEHRREAHNKARHEYMSAPQMRAMGLGRNVSGMCRDGRMIPIEVVLNPVKTPKGMMVLASVQDITARQEAEQSVRNARALLQSLIDSAHDFSIIAADTEGLITVFNTGAERMLGYSADEMIGKRTPLALHLADEIIERGMELSSQLEEHIDGFEVLVHSARLGRPENREWTYVRKDGSHFTVNLVVSPIRGAGGNLQGFMGIAYDVTARKEAEEALARAKEQAELASQAKSKFLANMSHEIRTPLNAVLGMAQLLSFGSLDDEQREYLRMIEVSGKSLLGILNDILDFSKIEAGRMELSESPFRLAEVMDALGNIMSVNAAQKDIELVICVDPDVPPVLRGDALRLQQILINLAGNALKFTQQGEVAVQVQVVSQEEDDIELRFTVSDSGIGMSEEQKIPMSSMTAC